MGHLNWLSISENSVIQSHCVALFFIMPKTLLALKNQRDELFEALRIGVEELVLMNVLKERRQYKCKTVEAVTIYLKNKFFVSKDDLQKRGEEWFGRRQNTPSLVGYERFLPLLHIVANYRLVFDELGASHEMKKKMSDRSFSMLLPFFQL